MDSPVLPDPLTGDPTAVALMKSEYDLEVEMEGLGRDAFLSRQRHNKDRGRETATAAGRSLMARLVGTVEEAVRGFQLEAASGKAGRRQTAAKYLTEIEPGVAAYLAMKTILDAVTEPRAEQRVAIMIGIAVEYELRFDHFEQQCKPLFRAIKERVNDVSQHDEYKRRVIVHAMNRFGVEWKSWDDRTRLLVGHKLLSLVIASTGIVAIEMRVTRRRRLNYVVPTPALSAEMQTITSRCELLTPAYMPTVVPPKPWTTVHDGGYHYLSRRYSLVKTSEKHYLEELQNRLDQMPAVLTAVNAVQATAWKINTRVLEVMRHVWEHSQPHGGLPMREDKPLPTPPHDFKENEPARKAWKRAAHEIHVENHKTRSKRLQVAKTISVAERYTAFERLYFPHQLDFRGRMYAVPMFLNPQGADYARSLITFAEGKAIGTVEAARWFVIHGANLFGVDKVSFDARVDWTYEHEEEIIRVAADPLANRFWCEADSPWQFLAWCFEYAEFAEQGYDYVSCIPVQLDGTCNGLQHFSAMLRDPIGGAAVNLLPAAKPQDIYQRVADVVTDKLKELAFVDTTGDFVDPEAGRMALSWLDFGIDRKLTKRPVMVLPYGGTLHSCREYVEAAVKEKGIPPGWELDLFKRTMFVAKIVWQSIGEVVVAARQAMDWLQKAARLAAAEGLPVNWTTPVGFHVLQRYVETKSREIDTHVSGGVVKRRLRLTITEPTNVIDKNRQAAAISPNFVHSMDGAALMLYVVSAKAVGIKVFSMIHDSYGTLAADTGLSAMCLRRAFVTLYARNR
ncbi:MAG: DNA-directed RNA polymerase, partial [Phenylobacterium sp.]